MSNRVRVNILALTEKKNLIFHVKRFWLLITYLHEVLISQKSEDILCTCAITVRFMSEPIPITSKKLKGQDSTRLLNALKYKSQDYLKVQQWSKMWSAGSNVNIFRPNLSYNFFSYRKAKVSPCCLAKAIKNHNALTTYSCYIYISSQNKPIFYWTGAFLPEKSTKVRVNNSKSKSSIVQRWS